MLGKKEIRLKNLKKAILDLGYIPNPAELSQTLKVSTRTVERDLEEISEQIPEIAVDDIKRTLMLRLRKRVPEMKDQDLIRLAEFFLSKKTEVKGDFQSNVTIECWDPDKEKLPENKLQAIHPAETVSQ